jgi:uncharacterized protein (TIGR03435 family)
MAICSTHPNHALTGKLWLLLACALASASVALSQPPPPPPFPPPPPGTPCPAPPPAAAPGAPPLAVPAFDIISVKPDSTNGGMMRTMFTGDGLSMTNLPVHMLLTQAYQLNDDRILGEPAWTRTDRFDVEAKVAGADVDTLKKLPFDQRRSMVLQILTDRFKMTAHHETRELPVYTLVIAKGGTKLKDVSDAKPTPDNPCPRSGSRMMMQPGKVTVTSGQIQTFMQILSQQLGRTIVDKTGLTGSYDFTLQWTPDNGPGGPPPPGAATGPAGPAGALPSPQLPDPSGASIFTAIQEQLGLKLEPTKAPVDVIVIDHIEKPTEN